MINNQYDVLIAGGGIAGIAAALAASRNGARVLLVEKQCVLGGLATLGLITIYLPLCDGMGNQVVFGIGEELLRLSIKYGYEDRYPAPWINDGTKEQRKKKRYEVQYNPHLFALLVEKLLLDTGVQILYDTLICGVSKNADKVETLIVENKSGRSQITAKAFVDATGDADICSYTGMKTSVFTDNEPAAWYYSLSKGTLKLNMLGSLDGGDHGGGTHNQLLSERYSGLDALKTSKILQLCHAKMLSDIVEKRNNQKADIVPVTLPVIPQTRMSRRLVGEYELDSGDQNRTFEDSIGIIGDWRHRGVVYQIPYQCLYAKGISNVITAGRCISVTTPVWDITRVIPCCALTGEAAGTAASMLQKSFSTLNVCSLRSRLIRQGTKVSF